MPPPYSPKCSQFQAVFGNFWQNHRLVSPPVGYPGSTNASGTYGISMAKLLSSFTVGKKLYTLSQNFNVSVKHEIAWELMPKGVHPQRISGRSKRCPPMDQNLLNLMHFLKNLVNLHVDAPSSGMAPLLRGILVRFHSWNWLCNC